MIPPLLSQFNYPSIILVFPNCPLLMPHLSFNTLLQSCYLNSPLHFATLMLLILSNHATFLTELHFLLYSRDISFLYDALSEKKVEKTKPKTEEVGGRTSIKDSQLESEKDRSSVTPVSQSKIRPRENLNIFTLIVLGETRVTFHFY